MYNLIMWNVDIFLINFYLLRYLNLVAHIAGSISKETSFKINSTQPELSTGQVDFWRQEMETSAEGYSAVIGRGRGSTSPPTTRTFLHHIPNSSSPP
jgi:hypothetical protein